jgi:hypothetical protein
MPCCHPPPSRRFLAAYYLGGWYLWAIRQVWHTQEEGQDEDEQRNNVNVLGGVSFPVERRFSWSCACFWNMKQVDPPLCRLTVLKRLLRKVPRANNNHGGTSWRMYAIMYKVMVLTDRAYVLLSVELEDELPLVVGWWLEAKSIHFHDRFLRRLVSRIVDKEYLRESTHALTSKHRVANGRKYGIGPY